jgi:hypothetical protein
MLVDFNASTILIFLQLVHVDMCTNQHGLPILSPTKMIMIGLLKQKGLHLRRFEMGENML